MTGEIMKFNPFGMGADGLMQCSDFRFGMSLTDFNRKTTRDEIVLLKSMGMIEHYRDFFSGKPISNILEYGTWEGGSPIFLAAATNARKIVGIDIRDPSDAILYHAARFGDRLKLVYQISQADHARVNAVIDQEFDGPVDVVIDDASHMYHLTKTAFEIAFARLRVGGFYVIEDWNWAHCENRHYDDYWAKDPALSNLVLELVLAVGSIGPVSSINVMPWGVVVEKGAEVPRDFKLEDLIRMGERRKYVRF